MEPARQAVSYLFIEPHVGDFSAQVMADPARPGRLSTDMGLEHLTNRLLTVPGLAAVMVALLIGGIILVRAAGRAKRDMANLFGRRLAPVPVQVERDKTGWQVRPVDGKTRVPWPLPPKAEPFFWRDQARAIALAWADLTSEERNRLRAAAYSAPPIAGTAPSASATAA